MRILILNTFLLITIFCFGQEHTVLKYKALFRYPSFQKNYTLLLADNSEFYLYGYGSNYDAIYPTRVFYGKYLENHDTLEFYFAPLDSIIIESNNGWENKFIFCGDTFFIWDKINTNDSFKYSYCIKREDRVEFENTDLIGNIFFLVNEQPANYSFSIKGSLPISFRDYVKSLQFSLKEITNDVCIAYYTDMKSSLVIKKPEDYFYNQDYCLDLFSLNLEDYFTNPDLFFYMDKRFDNFIPVIIDVDSLLTNSTNEIVLKLTDKHNVKWKYLTKNYYPNIPSVNSEYLGLNEFGQPINILGEGQKLKRKIIKKDISYSEAYKILIKSRYFNNKNFDLVIKDSLPTEPEIIFSLSNTFTINILSQIYCSFYSVPDSLFIDKKIKRQFVQNKSKAQINISNAGFNRNKTICFLPIEDITVTPTKKEILVFERRLNEFLLTGKIVDGNYSEMLEDKKSIYYPDMRNFRLFY